MKTKIFYSIILLSWIIITVYGFYHHEIWRDEMRALSIAITSPTIFHLPAYLQNEGHPILWYLFLKIGYSIFQTTSILPILSFIFSLGICVLILFKSPFNLVIKILLIFGYYCIYEYGINCRNYGISAFFLLLFAHQASKNKFFNQKSIVYLILAMYCNIYSTFASLLLSIWYFNEHFNELKNTKKLIFNSLFILVSFILVLVLVYPNKESIVVNHNTLNISLILNTFNVSNGFIDFIPNWLNLNSFGISILLFLSVILFLKHPKVMLVLILILLFTSFFSLKIYTSQNRHQGIYFYTIIVFAWYYFPQLKSQWLKKNTTSILISCGVIINLYLTSSLLIKGKSKFLNNLNANMSNSKDFGNWCSKYLENNSLIIPEADYTMESVVYYNKKDFFIPRENRIGLYVHFTKENKAKMSLNRLVELSDSFISQGKITYLVFNQVIKPNDYNRDFSYGKKFYFSKIDSELFLKKYKLIKVFNTNCWNEENYFIYKR